MSLWTFAKWTREGKCNQILSSILTRGKCVCRKWSRIPKPIANVRRLKLSCFVFAFFRSFTNCVLPFLTSLFVVFPFANSNNSVCFCSLAGVFYYLAKKPTTTNARCTSDCMPLKGKPIPRLASLDSDRCNKQTKSVQFRTCITGLDKGIEHTFHDSVSFCELSTHTISF